jgi:hypothetical protein
MKSRISRSVVVLLTWAAVSGCGGSSSPAGPGPQPSGLPTPGATPTPAPTPTPDPQAGLPPGPVTRTVLYIYQQYANGNPNAGGTLKDKVTDARGRWVARVGDFIVFDTTPLNAAGDKCRSSAPPAYRLLDAGRVFVVRGSSNPFLYRVDVVGQGEVELVSTVDGIDSAPLKVIVE